MPETITDEVLVANAQRNDESSLTALLLRYQPIVSKRAASFGNTFCDADDLIQEGMISLLSAVQTFNPGKGTRFRTYAGSCIDNRMTSLIRTLSRHNRVTDDIDSVITVAGAASSEPETVLIGKDEYQRVMQAVASCLSEYERNVLTAYMYGESYAEIARKFGKSIKSVSNAIARVREKLYRQIKQ